jgi:class 3 adenylate cyclase
VGAPGAVVVGDATRVQLERTGGFTLAALGEVTVKGKRKPIEAWTIS